MASFFRTYREKESGDRVDGVFCMAFIHNGDYHLTHISIFRDGLIDCWGLVDFEEFKKRVRSGWVVTHPPEGARVSVALLADFTAVRSSYWIEPEEFIKEVLDEIEALNGRPTTSDRCRNAWESYNLSPSETTKESLRCAYEQIPAHMRRFVLHDMDRKDNAIRRVLYPQQYKLPE